MASLYKKPVVRRDPETGEQIRTWSRKWWGQYRDAEGRLKRKPRSVDKPAAQSMLNELVRRVEREKAGLVDPTDEQRQRPLAVHLEEFKKYLANRDVSPKQRAEAAAQIEKVIKGCKWKKIADIDAGSTLQYLADLRRSGRSAQTYNHYLKSTKQFTRWLVRDRRTPADPLAHLSRLNVKTDRRHDRRALCDDEFSRLLKAARTGKRIEGISGVDRAMMYTLAAWTGFRKGEIGSLTRQSLLLDADPPTATVAASFSKHRREDTVILHPELAKQLRSWLKTKQLDMTQPLFPVSSKVPGGIDRKTHKMIKRDLAAARAKWIKEAKSKKERAKREGSDYLCYENHAGLFADFHACRHLFITSLERAGISPKMAQTLARHSDIRLTLGIYTHVERQDQVEAIGRLAGPPRR